MATKERKSLTSVAPGRIVERELEARGWSLETLAQYSGLSLETIKGIVHDSKPITDEAAQGLARSFGSTVQLWKSLESKYRAK
jgi:HTH-type transcriptional regulator/antitoxin HigA